MPDQMSPQEFASIGSNGLDFSSLDNDFGTYVGNRILANDRDRYWEMYNQQVNRIYNSTEAEKQRAWDKMMDDSKISRMIEDARQAGINPYYVVSNGNGSVPGGAAASSSSSSVGSSGSNKGTFAKVLALIIAFGRLLAA